MNGLINRLVDSNSDSIIGREVIRSMIVIYLEEEGHKGVWCLYLFCVSLLP